MATGWPMKTTYADGDVYAASDVNDITGTINLLGSSVAYTAGKNKIINGDFRFNQRAFTSNTVTSYNFDRWFQSNGGTTGTFTVTPQTFTAGAAPIAGYNGSTFIQGISAAGASADTFAQFVQRIEDVRSFAGQTVTISFFARATTGTPKIGLELIQNFGSGGSPSANVNTAVGTATISTSWARYSLSIAVPSISGKTIGTTANTSYLSLNIWLSAGSDFATRASSIGLQNNTFQVWGVQVESGSTATAFQTATGTIQGELAACQRYYWQTGLRASRTFGVAQFVNTVDGLAFVALPVTMRVNPSNSVSAATDFEVINAGGTSAIALTAISFGEQSVDGFTANLTTASGMTAGQASIWRSKSAGNATLKVSAEL